MNRIGNIILVTFSIMALICILISDMYGALQAVQVALSGYIISLLLYKRNSNCLSGPDIDDKRIQHVITCYVCFELIKRYIENQSNIKDNV